MLLLNRTKKTIACWILALVPPIIVVPTVYCCTNFGMSNTCLIPGALYIGILVMAFVVREGFFDIFGYQFSNWWNSWRKGAPKKYKDAYTYKTIKEEKRRNSDFIWLPFAVVGTILIALAIIFIFYPI